MTTKVKLLNEGPETVKIEVQGRDQGRFIQVDEKTLEPGKFADVYVTKGQSVQILEVEAE
jgi:hypothetical protein